MNLALNEMGPVEFFACMITIIAVTACGRLLHCVHIGVFQFSRTIDALEGVRERDVVECRNQLQELRACLESSIGEMRLDIANMELHLNQMFFDFEIRHEQYDDRNLFNRIHDVEMRLNAVENIDDEWTMRFNDLERRLPMPPNRATGSVAVSDNPWRCTQSEERISIEERIRRITHPNPWQEMCDEHDAAHPELGQSPTAVWL